MPLPPVAVRRGGALAVETAVEVQALEDELYGGGLEFGALVVSYQRCRRGQALYP